MNMSVTDHFTIDDAANLYGLNVWGNGYLRVSDSGHLIVTPDARTGHGADVFAAVQNLARQGIHCPVLLRFPQLLEAQVRKLADAFGNAIREYEYKAGFVPVFPIKVNQQRSVIDGLLESGWNCGLGLEAGSRPELLAAAAMQTPPDSLIVCNGFKDPDYLSSAALATRLGKQVAVVIEKPSEVEPIVELASRGETVPLIGFRIRLQARGSGLWERSGGFASKFGMTTRELLRSLETLQAAGLHERVVLLHFHIGSQITEIRKIKNAVREASRIYSKLRRKGVGIRYLDVGGGLGVDYDGSRTSSDASVNYNVQEYANDVVFGIHDVCESEGVPAPTIISESGRMMTAYHSILVTNVRGVIPGIDPEMPALSGNEHQVVQDLAEVARTITVKNYREFYHDAIEYRDQMYSMFNLGMLNLEERAAAECLFWSIAGKAVEFAKTAKFVAEEFRELDSKLHDKYICNFSVFQSLPDHWALDQLFPVMPIHRLNESPTRKATLVDITCDSDGEVEKFTDRRSIKTALEVHALTPGSPYYLAFLLIGAYQDTMGDMHNLFGRVHEAEVLVDWEGRTTIRNVRDGDRAVETLRCYGFDEERLVASIEAGLKEKVERGLLDRDEARTLLDDYRRRLQHYTYLDSATEPEPQPKRKPATRTRRRVARPGCTPSDSPA